LFKQQPSQTKTKREQEVKTSLLNNQEQQNEPITSPTQAKNEPSHIKVTPPIISNSVTIQTTQEPTNQEQEISIKPTIAEIERLIHFLADKHNIKLPNDLIILIQKTEPTTRGYYSPNSWTTEQEPTNQEQESQELSLVFKQQNKINEITISSQHLIFKPYSTIAHEFAHYLNTYLDKYEGNTNNYHTKEFKSRAEQLGLIVEKGKYGFNSTTESQEFKDMITNEFKPNPQAFKIFQPLFNNEIVGIDVNGNFIDKNGNIIKPKKKGNSRLILYECSCKCKIRTARATELNATCNKCHTDFKEVIKQAEPSED
jgi:hypothetical protein